MKYVVFALCFIIVILVSYTVYVSSELEISENNNAKLQVALNEQQATINELQRLYDNAVRLRRDTHESVRKYNKNIDSTISVVKREPTPREQEIKINNFYSQYNKCVSGISNGDDKQCDEFLRYR